MVMPSLRKKMLRSSRCEPDISCIELFLGIFPQTRRIFPFVACVGVAIFAL